MRRVLGIDAAWTAKQPSGVALVEGQSECWRIVAVAPSYEAFLRIAQAQAIDWSIVKVAGSAPAVVDLIGAAEALGGAAIDVVAVDMPLSRGIISGRREADRQVSQVFGSRGCSTHSPSVERPGELGAQLMSDLDELGFRLDTSESNGHRRNRVIEVYPHTGLLYLLDLDYRLPYKVSKSLKYWPGSSVNERNRRLLRQFERIYAALEAELGPIPFELPAIDDVPTLSFLKRFEDALDALICAWVGIEYLSGRARAYGDRDAAIWVPESN